MSGEMNDETGSPPPRAKRGISLWLAASLAANALLIGVVGGRLLAPDARRDRVGPEPHSYQRELHDRAMSSIDEKRRDEFRKAMRRVWIDSRPVRQELDAARRAAIEAGKAEDYDPDAMKAALENLRAAESELRRHAHEAMAELLADATPQERLSIITRFSGLGDQPMRERMKHRLDKDWDPRENGPRDGLGRPPEGGPPPPREDRPPPDGQPGSFPGATPEN